jgi:hypothetical protein
MQPAPRREDFRLLTHHGKHPDSRCRELLIRNWLYEAGVLRVLNRRQPELCIRLVGYEVPVYKAMRNQCIDLLGYDRFRRPWIVELKKGGSNEAMEFTKVLSQVRRYAQAFEGWMRDGVQHEIRERLFWPEFSFQGAAQMMVLADRTFFRRCQRPEITSQGILLCSYARTRSEESLLRGRRGEVGLKQEDML